MAEMGSILQVVPAKPFPDLMYKDESGQTRLLSQDLGKLTIVHFWATWCESCIDEYPLIDQIQKEYRGRGLKVVSISMDGVRNLKQVKAFYGKYHIASLQAYLDVSNGAFRAAKARGLPTSYFIDGSGMKIAIAEGPLDWRTKDTLNFIEFHLRAAK